MIFYYYHKKVLDIDNCMQKIQLSYQQMRFFLFVIFTFLSCLLSDFLLRV